MKALKIASIAAALAAVSVAPTLACDYSREASNVTASAPAAPAAEVQAAATSQPADTTQAVAATPAGTQTAETTATAAPQPKLN